MRLDRTYFTPTLLASLVHLAVLGVISGVWIGQESDVIERPRHIEAVMFDLDRLANNSAAIDQSQEQRLAREQADREVVERRNQQEAERLRQAELTKQKTRDEAEQRARDKAAQEADKIARAKAEAQNKAEAEAQAKAQAKEAEQRAAEIKRVEQERQAKAEAEARRVEDQRKADEAARKAREVAARAEKERADKQRQEALAAERAKEEAAAKEKEQEAQRRAAAEQRSTQVVGDMQSYIQGLLQKNWRIPATARNGMKAIIEINLFPNGQIDRVNIYESSGDLHFDRSAVQAVERVERFERIADVDPILFERRLRRVLVTFRPEGLRW